MTQSVLTEAAIVGLLGSFVGLAMGIGIAVGLIALLEAIGADIPTSTVQILPRTVLVSVLLGVGVTLLASLLPALRSARVPPIAAMRDTVVDVSESLGRRLLIGGIVTVAGAGLLLDGLFADASNPLVLVGVGAMLSFIGVAVLSVIAARPLAGLIGAPLPRWFGTAGMLARENAMRNPRRTASTASALMIGLGLVATVSVVFASVRASLADLLNEQLSADFVISTDSFTPFSLDVAGRLDERPEIGAVSGLRVGEWQYRGDGKQLQSVNPRTITDLVDVEMRTGSVASLARGAVLVDHDEAKAEGWKTGDVIEMTFAETGSRSVVLGGTYDDNALLGDTIVSTETYQQNFTDALDFAVLAKAARGVAVAEAREAVDAVLKDYPNVKGETRVNTSPVRIARSTRRCCSSTASSGWRSSSRSSVSSIPWPCRCSSGLERSVCCDRSECRDVSCGAWCGGSPSWCPSSARRSGWWSASCSAARCRARWPTRASLRIESPSSRW